MKEKTNPCAKCGYHYKEEDDRFPYCHFEGPDGWAPCEQKDYETEDANEEPNRVKNIYTVFISDSAVYDEIEAESEEEAKMLALDWYSERMPNITVKPAHDVVYLIHEENHGLIGVANSWDSAIDFLITSEWIYGGCELWFPEKRESICIQDLFPDWQDWLRHSATHKDFENMGYRIEEKEVYVK